MKFYKEHQEDIFEAFDRHGYSKAQFHFIKRRGRIITLHRNSSATFSFLLKKEIILNEETGDFEDESYFEVRHNEDEILQQETWENVIIQFNKWLKNL